MKVKQLINKVIFAGLVLSLASISTAKVSLNPQGIGQVLIYPYYTVNNDMNTLISLTNISDKAKALKIKFLEGKNNHDALVFNIYIAPHDEWTAALVATTSTVNGHQGEHSVRLFTSDNTCTVPTNISSQEFLPYGYEADSLDSYGPDLSRVTEGHIQVFDMGNVTGEFADWALTSTDTQNCEGLQDNWLTNGTWDIDTNVNMQKESNASLFGTVTLIDVITGVSVAYNADAITGYSDEIQHTSPGSNAPNLNTGTSLVSNTSSFATTWDFPYQAISALFTMKTLYAEYIVGNGIGANTETVITFPTKQFHVEPFTLEPFSVDPSSCEPIDITANDRDGNTSSQSLDLCFGANILEFVTDDNGTGPSTIFASNNVQRINTSFDKGWVQLQMNQSVSRTVNEGTVSEQTTTLTGLPYIGFTVQRYTNSNLSGGILANYAGLTKHKGYNDLTATLIPSK